MLLFNKFLLNIGEKLMTAIVNIKTTFIWNINDVLINEFAFLIFLFLYKGGKKRESELPIPISDTSETSRVKANTEENIPKSDGERDLAKKIVYKNAKNAQKMLPKKT
jgi:hypothetical protein